MAPPSLPLVDTRDWTLPPLDPDGVWAFLDELAGKFDEGRPCVDIRFHAKEIERSGPDLHIAEGARAETCFQIIDGDIKPQDIQLQGFTSILGISIPRILMKHNRPQAEVFDFLIDLRREVAQKFGDLVPGGFVHRLPIVPILHALKKRLETQGGLPSDFAGLVDRIHLQGEAREVTARYSPLSVAADLVFGPGLEPPIQVGSKIVLENLPLAGLRRLWPRDYPLQPWVADPSELHPAQVAKITATVVANGTDGAPRIVVQVRGLETTWQLAAPDGPMQVSLRGDLDLVWDPRGSLQLKSPEPWSVVVRQEGQDLVTTGLKFHIHLAQGSATQGSATQGSEDKWELAGAELVLTGLNTADLQWPLPEVSLGGPTLRLQGGEIGLNYDPRAEGRELTIRWQTGYGVGYDPLLWGLAEGDSPKAVGFNLQGMTSGSLAFTRLTGALLLLPESIDATVQVAGRVGNGAEEWARFSGGKIRLQGTVPDSLQIDRDQHVRLTAELGALKTFWTGDRVFHGGVAAEVEVNHELQLNAIPDRVKAEGRWSLESEDGLPESGLGNLPFLAVGSGFSVLYEGGETLWGLAIDQTERVGEMAFQGVVDLTGVFEGAPSWETLLENWRVATQRPGTLTLGPNPVVEALVLSGGMGSGHSPDRHSLDLNMSGQIPLGLLTLEEGGNPIAAKLHFWQDQGVSDPKRKFLKNSFRLVFPSLRGRGVVLSQPQISGGTRLPGSLADWQKVYREGTRGHPIPFWLRGHGGLAGAAKGDWRLATAPGTGFGYVHLGPQLESVMVGIASNNTNLRTSAKFGGNNYRGEGLVHGYAKLFSRRGEWFLAPRQVGLKSVQLDVDRGGPEPSKGSEALAKDLSALLFHVTAWPLDGLPRLSGGSLDLGWPARLFLDGEVNLSLLARLIPRNDPVLLNVGKDGNYWESVRYVGRRLDLTEKAGFRQLKRLLRREERRK